jgi:hypothetical protein
MNTTRFALEDDNGRRIGVPPHGLLIGRSSSCDLVVTDQRLSKRHLFLRPTATGLWAFPTGRNPIQVDGVPVEGPSVLQAGNELLLGACRLRVLGMESQAPQVRWYVSLRDDLLRAVPRSGLTVGGSQHDDLHMPSWAEGALALRPAADSLWAELFADLVMNDVAAAAGTLRAVESHTVFDGGLTVWADFSVSAETTRAMPANSAPTEIVATYLPRGGELALRFGDAWRRVELPELRLRFFALLVAPPNQGVAGDWVSDETLLRGVWPRQSRSNLDLNVLAYRIRKNLLKCDVNPDCVFERGVGRVRLRLSPQGSARLVVN